MNNGEQKGVNKRSHDTMIVPGHKIHSSRTQRMSETDSVTSSQSGSTAANVANLPALLSVVPTARIRKNIQDIVVPARQSSSSIPVAQATAATAQAMVLIDRTPAEIARHPVARATPVNSTFARMPTTSIRSAIAPN